MQQCAKFLILAFFIFLSCAHHSDDRSAYQTDIRSIQNNAKQSLVDYEDGFKEKAYREHQNISNTKKSMYGLNRIQLGCQRNETNYVSAFLFGVIDASDGRVDFDNYTYCAEYNFTNWLRLNWTCSGKVYKLTPYKARSRRLS